MASVRVRRGSEGPAHDPYSWTEIEFTKADGTVVMIRQGGLGYERLFVNGKKVLETFEGQRDPASTKFYELTGMTPEDAEEVPERAKHAVRRKLPKSEQALLEEIDDYHARLLRSVM
jgi:hypothetical protein